MTVTTQGIMRDAIEEVRRKGGGSTMARLAAKKPDRKTVLLLKMMADAAGDIDASDDRHSLLNYFCGDRAAGDDTFNLASKAGLIHVTHDSLSETSRARLTDAGRAAIAAAKAG